VKTSYPSGLRYAVTRLKMDGSSSMTRIFAMGLL
jgi:hypothetical protein